MSKTKPQKKHKRGKVRVSVKFYLQTLSCLTNT